MGRVYAHLLSTSEKQPLRMKQRTAISFLRLDSFLFETVMESSQDSICMAKSVLCYDAVIV